MMGLCEVSGIFMWECVWYFWWSLWGLFLDVGSKGKRIKAQKAQYKEFVKGGLKTRFQWIGQRSQWIKDGNKTKKNRFYAKKSFLGKVRRE